LSLFLFILILLSYHSPPYREGPGMGLSWLLSLSGLLPLLHFICFSASFTTCSTGSAGCSVSICTTTF
jgi:hypothetical protein